VCSSDLGTFRNQAKDRAQDPGPLRAGQETQRKRKGKGKRRKKIAGING
jgi:hypothetical protein